MLARPSGQTRDAHRSGRGSSVSSLIVRSSAAGRCPASPAPTPLFQRVEPCSRCGSVGTSTFGCALVRLASTRRIPASPVVHRLDS
jgi:hypothetical protein